MNVVVILAEVKKYWPSVVAGLYLLYVASAGDSAQIGPAFAALLATFGVNHSVASAHAKIDIANGAGKLLQ